MIRIAQLLCLLVTFSPQAWARQELDIGPDPQTETPPQTVPPTVQPDIKSKKEDLRSITIHARSVPLEQILDAIGEQSASQFVIPDDFRSLRFTLSLKKVSVAQALEVLLDPKGLAYESLADTNIFVIKKRSETKPRVVTRVYRLKHLQLNDLGIGPKITSNSESTSAFHVVSATSDPAATKNQPSPVESNLLVALKSVLSEQGKLQVDPFSRSVIVTDFPERMGQIVTVLQSLDIPIPQVLIEAELIETNADLARKIGIEYGDSEGALAFAKGPGRVIQYPIGANGSRVFPNPGDMDGASVGEMVGQPKTGVYFGILSFERLTMLLRALETNAEGKFLARPRIVTLSNRTAQIRVTADTAIGIQSASLIAQNGLVVSTAERQATGISLRVTPEVSDAGEITLLIEPSVSRPQASTFFPGRFVDPQTRDLTTTVKVKDGETLHIGGLLSTEEEEIERSVPFFGSIPLLGALFRSTSHHTSTKELMIFITPRILR